MAEIMDSAVAPVWPRANPPSPASAGDVESGDAILHFVIDELHCPSCIREIEAAMKALPGVRAARMNFSTQRLTVQADRELVHATNVIEHLADHHYRANPFEPETIDRARDREEQRLLRALGVAGFAAANIMMLSVVVWFGVDLGDATRTLLHWISALIALPAVVYAGQPFFSSALTALKNRALNMDVPISLAVLLAAGMSLVDTMAGAEAVYFDAAVSLLFFLLIGRLLDRQMRRRANQAVENLMAARPRQAMVLEPTGQRSLRPLDQVWPGMQVVVAPGEQISLDGDIARGRSDLDTSLITGESLPRHFQTGERVHAGTLNLTAELVITVQAREEESLLAEITRQMEAAEQSRARYVRLADRAAAIYAPAVHIVAIAAFLIWWALLDASWQEALRIAIAVLIITCPCALGLAVPAVQVVASGLLFRLGILLKSGDGLERLGEVDTVVFDKTGTLTQGRPVLLDDAGYGASDLACAGALAASSKHPLAQALSRAAADAFGIEAGNWAFQQIKEEPGMGLAALGSEGGYRLGNGDWVGAENTPEDSSDASELWLKYPDGRMQPFYFVDALKPDAKSTVSVLQKRGFEVHLLSGDRTGPVQWAAGELGIETWQAGVRPDQKKAYLDRLKLAGHKVLMVGDGLNDAPALSAATVSIAFAKGADISQAAADFVCQSEALSPLPKALTIARRARWAILQNFTLALIYNLIAVPLAVGGLVTPLIAAVAMSSSSIIVTANALRLRVYRRSWM